MNGDVFGNSRTVFWAKGSAWALLSSEVPWELTDSVKFDFPSGFQFLNPRGFEHLLPLCYHHQFSLSSVLLFVIFHYSFVCFQCLRLTFSYLGD